MRVMLLTEHHLEFLSIKGGCTGSSESTLIKMTHCWKSHVAAPIKILKVSNKELPFKSPSALKIACSIILFPYTQSNDNLLKFIRCSVPGVVLIVSIPDICLLPYFVYSHEYRRILCYPLRSNSGWLPIRCAYFILFCRLDASFKIFNF